jgi:hypothetical protein
VGREINYRNPHGSIPSPAAKDIPTTLWYTPQVMPVAWRGIPIGGTDDTAQWDTPLFDLRPDLRSAQNDPKMGIPIWDTSARLYIQVFGLLVAPANTQFLRLGCVELANAIHGNISTPEPPRAVAPPGGGFPAQVGRDPVIPVTPVIDITSELMFGTNQTDSVIMVFAPLGEGYPVRYWKLRLLWENIGAAGPNAVNIQAAVY